MHSFSITLILIILISRTRTEEIDENEEMCPIVLDTKETRKQEDDLIICITTDGDDEEENEDQENKPNCLSDMAPYVKETDMTKVANKWLRNVRREEAITERDIKRIERRLKREEELHNPDLGPPQIVIDDEDFNQATVYNLQHTTVPDDFKQKFRVTTGYIVSKPGQRYKMTKNKRMTMHEKHMKSFLLASKNNIRDVRHCAYECYYARICMAFNYSKTRQKCELLSVKSDAAVGVLQPSNSTNYFERYL